MRAALAMVTSVLLLTGAPSGAPAAEIDVAAGDGTLQGAIAHAEPGDTLRLGTGDYQGPVIVDRPLTIIGNGESHIEGTGTGSVIRVVASDVTLQGLVVTGSGIRLNDLDAAISISKEAERARVLDNEITGNLIGVDVHGGRNVLVRGNAIVGRNDLRVSERGPGIYVWNAPGLVVEGNDVRQGRDGVFISTSNEAVYRNNTFADLRFAFHSMYANKIEVTGNVSRGNDMGFAFMYSRDLTVRDNVSMGDLTHGIFLNFANKADIINNEVRDGGEKCLFVYNANMNRIASNVFEGCDIGIHFTAGSEGNAVTGNAFIANRTQVKYVGSRWIEWSESGLGNYWSDHAAFDIDGNGVTDSAYRPNDIVDQITWQQPMAKLLLGSPAVQLIRWSQSQFPGLLPGGVIDSNPLMTPAGAGTGVRHDNSSGAQ